MATSYKPAQVQGTSAVTTYATLYNVPSGSSAIISNLIICNQAASSATYRIGLDTAAGTPGASEFLFYDVPIDANDTVVVGLGLSLDSGKYVRVSSSANTVTFTASIAEMS